MRVRKPTLVSAAVVSAVLSGVALATAGTDPASGADCYPPPVSAPVSAPFVAPTCDYCTGHRGLDFATRPGQTVTAVSSGVVSFAGPVAGVRYVVVAQDDGRRATYGYLATSRVAQGARVLAGAIVGTSGDLLFFGFRNGERYLDPAPLLGAWRRSPWLVPVDGAPRRPGPPSRLVCGNPHQYG